MSLKTRLQVFPRHTTPYTVFLLVLSTIIFAIDAITPDGDIHWIFYLVPLFLAFLSRKTFCIVVTFGFVVAYDAAGAVLSGHLPPVQNIVVLDSINRLEGLLTFVCFGLVSRSFIKSRDHYKRASAELQVSRDEIFAEKERLTVTLHSIGDGVISTNAKGEIDSMNRVAEKLTGWTIGEARGKALPSVFCIVNDATRDTCENPVTKVLSSGSVVELENHTVLVSRNGTEHHIADSAAPIVDANRQTLGVVLVFRDITEKQKIFDTIQRAGKLDSLGVLAGGIAHDFNNLMGGILGFIDLAKEETDRQKASEYLANAMATIDRARSLTQQLLTFATGGAPIKKITPLIPFIRDAAQFAISGTNVTCRFYFQENLRHCVIDKGQISQVISNIIINAHQAMSSGGFVDFSAANVSVNENGHPLLLAGDYVKISIQDYGLGIPKDLQPRIFDPFFTTKPKGHGLGLATCYSILNRHGGGIDVESVPGKGSTFHVYLPATDAPGSDTATTKTSPHHGSGTIVVMDDEEVIRNVMSKMLEAAGYSVVLKSEGMETLDFFVRELKAGHEIKAYILDLTIPSGMGGLDVARGIRVLDSKTPVFVASGYADDPVMRNPADYGITASIRKPFERRDLWQMLNTHLI